MIGLSIFGKVEFIKTQRTKNISVRILAEGLRVSLPRHVSPEEAEKSILKQKESIIAKQQRIRAKTLMTTLREDSTLQTLTFKVECVKTERKDVFFALNKGVLTIQYPMDADLQNPDVQSTCWKGINYFMKKEAKRVLPFRLQELADQHQFTFTDLKIQSSKTRWGSCSQRGNINLSFFIMLLPQHLVDYVILHELCHTREMNHGERFWGWMDKVTDGKTMALRAELKNYNIPA